MFCPCSPSGASGRSLCWSAGRLVCASSALCKSVRLPSTQPPGHRECSVAWVPPSLRSCRTLVVNSCGTLFHFLAPGPGLPLASFPGRNVYLADLLIRGHLFSLSNICFPFSALVSSSLFHVVLFPTPCFSDLLIRMGYAQPV